MSKTSKSPSNIAGDLEQAGAAIEKLESVVMSIHKGVDKILNSGISESALVNMIQHAAHGKPKKADIIATIDGLANLWDYLYGEDDEPFQVQH